MLRYTRLGTGILQSCATLHTGKGTLVHIMAHRAQIQVGACVGTDTNTRTRSRKSCSVPESLEEEQQASLDGKLARSK
jgi:hypothetical protein